MKALRYLWATPWTLVASLALLVYWPKKVRWSEGALECQVVRLLPEWAGAQALGWIICYGPRWGWGSTMTRRHERVHVKQGLNWGPLFPLRYFGECALRKWQGKDPYWENSMEMEARRGEYETDKPRPRLPPP